MAGEEQWKGERTRGLKDQGLEGSLGLSIRRNELQTRVSGWG